MRICRFNEGSIGVVEDDKVFDVSDCLKIAHVGTYPQPRHDLFVEALPEMRNAILERLASATVYPLAEVKLLSPIANPGKIVCAPLNYDFHVAERSAEHTSELQLLMRISYAVFCLNKHNHKTY